MAYAKGLKVPLDLGNRARLSHTRQQPLALTAVTLPPAYDLRDLGFITPVDDQGPCGDCWNFSGTDVAAMSAVYAGVSKRGPDGLVEAVGA